MGVASAKVQTEFKKKFKIVLLKTQLHDTAVCLLPCNFNFIGAKTLNNEEDECSTKIMLYNIFIRSIKIRSITMNNV